MHFGIFYILYITLFRLIVRYPRCRVNRDINMSVVCVLYNILIFAFTARLGSLCGIPNPRGTSPQSCSPLCNTSSLVCCCVERAFGNSCLEGQRQTWTLQVCAGSRSCVWSQWDHDSEANLEARMNTNNTPLHKVEYAGQSARNSVLVGQRDPLGAESKELYALWPKQSSQF